MSKTPSAGKSNSRLLLWLTLALTIAIAGWSGMYYLIMHIHPTAPARLAFLGLWGSALAGTSWPALLAINQRWSKSASVGRIWRQSGWIALYGIAIAWLQIKRVLTLAVAGTLAGLLALLELLLILHQHEQIRDQHEETV